jgi:hypothetical protein
MFLVGIFTTPDNKTPKNLQIFLALVVDELAQLIDTGVLLFDAASSTSFVFRATCFVASFDYQAVIKVLCITGCSSSKPCYRCQQFASKQASEVFGGNTMSCLSPRRLLRSDHPLREGERRQRPARRTQSEYQSYGQMAHDALGSSTYEDTVRALSHKDFCQLARLPLWDMVLDVTVDDMHLTVDVLGKFTGLARGSSAPTNAVQNRRAKRRKKALAGVAPPRRKKKAPTAAQLRKENTRIAAEERYLVGHQSLAFEYAQLKVSTSRLRAIEHLIGQLRNFLPAGVLRPGVRIFSGHMKAHDCLNITRWCIMPYLLRHTWSPEKVGAMAAVLDCIRGFKVDLPSHEFDRAGLENRTAEAIVNFADHFPMSELVTVVHLMFHVPEDLCNWGSSRHRWQYSAERYLGWLVRLIKNRSKPIANVLKMNDVMCFATGQSHSDVQSDVGDLWKKVCPRWAPPPQASSTGGSVVFPNARSWCGRKYYSPLRESE